MNVLINGVEVAVNDRVIANILTERLSAGFKAPVQNEVLLRRADQEPPPIGADWPFHGGVYAGIGRDADSLQRIVIVGPEAPKELSWKDAQTWVKELNAAAESNGGFGDWALPTRRDQALCWANVPELFKKEWYWSGEQYAGHDAYAWCQSFGNGGQDGGRKDNEFRARAVRRLAI